MVTADKEDGMVRLSVLIPLVLWVGCSSSEGDDGDDTSDGLDPTRCGDLRCNGFETASSCPDDCPCSASPDNCTGETLCVAARCEDAFPRSYAITAISVTVPTTRPSDGTSWDPLGGAPDLFLGRTDGTAITPFVLNSFAASFPGPLDVTLAASGMEVAIAVWDDDAPAAPDGALTCRNTLHGTELRTRTFSCAGAIGTLSATIQPR